MRSGLIFRATDHVSNRFLLCRMISASARKMHRGGIATSQSINESLLALDSVKENAAQKASPVVEEPEVAAATT